MLKTKIWYFALLLLLGCGENHFKHRFCYSGRTKMITLTDSITEEWPDQFYQETYLRNLYLFPDGIQLPDSSLLDQSFSGIYYLFDVNLEQQRLYISNYQMITRERTLLSEFVKPTVYNLSKYEEPFSFIFYSKGDTLNVYCVDLNIQLFCSMKQIEVDSFVKEIVDEDQMPVYF